MFFEKSVQKWLFFRIFSNFYPFRKHIPLKNPVFMRVSGIRKKIRIWTLFGHLDTFFEIRTNFSKKHKKLNGIFSRICFAPQFEKRNIIAQKWPFLTQKFEK